MLPLYFCFGLNFRDVLFKLESTPACPAQSLETLRCRRVLAHPLTGRL